MKFKTIIAASLLFLSLTAAAQFQIVAKAHEVALEDFTAPLTANGVVVFKACSSCEQQRVRVTADTRYAINGETVRLEDFRASIADAEGDKGAVTVKHHFESNTIVLLDVWF